MCTIGVLAPSCTHDNNDAAADDDDEDDHDNDDDLKDDDDLADWLPVFPFIVNCGILWYNIS